MNPEKGQSQLPYPTQEYSPSPVVQQHGNDLPPPYYSGGANSPSLGFNQPMPGQSVPIQQGPHVVAINAPSPIIGHLGPNPNNIICPSCQTSIRTKVTKHNSGMAYLSGGILCMIGCILGCCLIPCCMDSCKASEHYCPNCDRYLGKFVRYF